MIAKAFVVALLIPQLATRVGLGEKVKIENVGIFKCGVRNKCGGFEDAKDLTASTLSPRILFQPEYTTSTQNGVTRAAVAMLGDITFEEATDYEAPKAESVQP